VAPLDHRHLPAHLIDRLLAGLLPEPEAAAGERQAQACAECAGRLQRARQAREGFLARNPPEARARALIAGQARPPRRRHLLLWLVPTFSAVAAVVLVAALRERTGGDLPDGGPEIIAKGGAPSLAFTVRRPGSAPRPGRDGEALRAGDTLELHVGLGRFARAHLFALGAGGRAQPLFDRGLQAAGAPPTLVLDDDAAPERIVALFHDGGADLAYLRRAIAAAAGAGAAALEAPLPSVLPGAPGIELRSILVRKEPPRRSVAPDVSRTP
jgi:hypothetical protein